MGSAKSNGVGPLYATHWTWPAERSLALQFEAEGVVTAESNLARRHGLDISKPMLDWKNCPAVERSPDKVSGAWVFRGTRVPVKALFENLEAGAKVDDFLAWFEGVTRQQVDAVLEHASASLTPAK